MKPAVGDKRYQARNYIGEPIGLPQATANAAFKQLRGEWLAKAKIEIFEWAGESWKFVGLSDGKS
jgi:hypothetical protein